MRGALALIGLLAGCGDELDIDGHSGSRLGIPWLDFNGTRQWQPEEGRHLSDGRFINTEDYFDRERGENCAPEPWLDGITRCTPATELISRKLFADAQCTVRVTESPQTFKYVGDYDDKCGIRRLWHVFPVTSTMPRTELYYLSTDSKCYAATSSAPMLGVLGPELAPDVFAAVDIESEPKDERIQLRLRASEDGLRLPLSLNDRLLGAVDVVRSGEDDLGLPRGAVLASPETLFYADAECTRGYVRVDPGCAAPQAAYDDTGYYALGDRAASPPGFVLTLGTCMPANPPSGELYEVRTASPIALVGVQITHAMDGQQRIQLQHARAGQVALQLRELYDTELQAECVPRRFPDDVVRCAPDQSAAQLLPGIYTDAACQMPIVLAGVAEGHRRPALVMQDRTLLGGPLDIYEVGERYVGPAFALGGVDGMQCIDAFLRASYRIGREIDWSELATGTPATD